MAESSPDRRIYEKKIVERVGGQQELDLAIPEPTTNPMMQGKLFDTKEAAN
jgi:hypothetical protein